MVRDVFVSSGMPTPTAQARNGFPLCARALPLISLVLLIILTPGVRAEVITLRNAAWTIAIQPESLEVVATPANQRPIRLSVPQPNLGAIAELEQTGDRVRWVLMNLQTVVEIQLTGDNFRIAFTSKTAGHVAWPIIPADNAIEAYILPLSEGSYVPSRDPKWLGFLTGRGEMNTTEGLSMPFWGVSCGEHTVTYILENPFNNALVFEDDRGALALRLTHEFTRNHTEKHYALSIRLGDESPVTPAKIYRQWLIDNGALITLAEKIKRVPNVEKLLGAAHIYLWENAPISRHDIRDWRRFAEQLRTTNESPPSRNIWERLDTETQEALAALGANEKPYLYLQNQIVEALNVLLTQRDFSASGDWQGIEIPGKLLAKGTSVLPDSEIVRLNGQLLEAAFADMFLPQQRWGNGVSVKMMEQLAENGFDRLWLGLDSWQAGYNHPEAIERAKELGYLIGSYDSYHSIHRPGEVDTWETAQFDLALYESGAIVRADGTKVKGFAQKGYKLSPIAARPYVEARVNRIMSELPRSFNSWFIDCDAYGEVYDNYSKMYPTTQQTDAQARLDRMAWIRDTHNLVIGSEGGASYAAETIHFAHGMMTPVIGWGDPELQKDKTSKYYLGGYWPPDAPAIYVKQVPLKEAYYHIYFDPRFRLPLDQIVFHDSVVTTHHWGYASLKFSDMVTTVALLELLYNVPPLYHMNLDEFEKHKARMKAHYAFFSPLHRELGRLPMTDFVWLTEDRLVQRATFGDGVEMVANFSDSSYEYHAQNLPPESAMVRWLETGTSQIFTPAPKD